MAPAPLNQADDARVCAFYVSRLLAMTKQCGTLADFVQTAGS